MYENPFTFGMTFEGNTDIFQVNISVLQGDRLTHPFYHLLGLYSLHLNSFFRRIDSKNDKVAESLEILAELTFADGIALIENTIKKAESLLHKIKTATQNIGLFLHELQSLF